MASTDASREASFSSRACVRRRPSTTRTASHEITTVGWQRLVRDAGILDNAVTATDMDALFTAVDAGRAWARMENKHGAIDARRPGLGSRTFDSTLTSFASRFVARRRFGTRRRRTSPARTRRCCEITCSRGALGRDQRDDRVGRVGSRESMNEVTSRDVALRRVYGHYATLHMFSATTQKINWRTVSSPERHAQRG